MTRNASSIRWWSSPKSPSSPSMATLLRCAPVAAIISTSRGCGLAARCGFPPGGRQCRTSARTRSSRPKARTACGSAAPFRESPPRPPTLRMCRPAKTSQCIATPSRGTSTASVGSPRSSATPARFGTPKPTPPPAPWYTPRVWRCTASTPSIEGVLAVHRPTRGVYHGAGGGVGFGVPNLAGVALERGDPTLAVLVPRDGVAMHWDVFAGLHIRKVGGRGGLSRNGAALPHAVLAFGLEDLVRAEVLHCLPLGGNPHRAAGPQPLEVEIIAATGAHRRSVAIDGELGDFGELHQRIELAFLVIEHGETGALAIAEPAHYFIVGDQPFLARGVAQHHEGMHPGHALCPRDHLLDEAFRTGEIGEIHAQGGVDPSMAR